MGIALAGGLACSGCTNLYRTSWQQPDRVIESLNLAPGAYVADLGAGGGYFLPYLVDAVGSEGKVFAVDVDPACVRGMAAAYVEEGQNRAQAFFQVGDELCRIGLGRVLGCDLFFRHGFLRDRVNRNGR